MNIAARIQRHSRILKHSLAEGIKGGTYYSYGYNFVIFVVIVLMPIYPVFASFVHSNTVIDFYRGDIDESSILSSYVGEEGDEGSGLIVENKESFLSINTLLNDERDISGNNEVIEYVIESGDSITSIAYKFGVSNNSIYWANNLSKSSVLRTGTIINIPPVSGVIHKVKSGETLSGIAQKYEIDSEKIRIQNGLGTNDPLITEMVLVIPGAIKKEEPKPAPAKKQYAKQGQEKTKTSNTKNGYSFAKYAASEDVDYDGAYSLTKKSPQHTFYWGNCTWFVAQYKNVNWGGNAKDWLSNAKKAGNSTGSKPTAGSIVVFNGKGYNPRYGHVGIVMEVSGSNIIVKDMNYRELNEVTTRKVSSSDRAIIGYIYVD